jgi:hypothetical protein
MGCLKLTYYEQGNALEVNSNFFGEALEKKGYSDFFRLKAYTYEGTKSCSYSPIQYLRCLNNVLGATNPENAPNYENLPTEYPVKGELPSVQNRTTEPMFIKE